MNSSGTTPQRRITARSQRVGLSAQVLMGLTAEERASLERIAELEMRSLSATARMLFLEGLRTYEQASEV